MGAIQRLSDYFHVPKAWVIEDGGMDGVQMVAGVFVKSASNGLSDDENTLLDLYRSMSGDGRIALLAAARGLATAYPGETAVPGVSRSA